MDEVGRGTGTNDGLSIAWAVSEELLGRIKCRTFFATHYHELSLLQHLRMVNRSMEVLEKDGGIVFLRRLKEGPAAEAYGLHVARLAGLSPAVLDRARQIMDQLGIRDRGIGIEAGSGESVNHIENEVNRQKNKVADAILDAILRELSALDPNAVTPLEALALVSEWKKRLTNGEVPVFAAQMGSGAKPRAAKAAGGKPADSSPSLFD
jgi:DNA mismatch repair protein MutS